MRLNKRSGVKIATRWEWLYAIVESLVAWDATAETMPNLNSPGFSGNIHDWVGYFVGLG